MCYAYGAPKGRLLILRHYRILYQRFPFVKHFFRAWLIFLHFSGNFWYFRAKTGQKAAPGVLNRTPGAVAVIF